MRVFTSLSASSAAQLVHPTKTELWFESVVCPSFYKRRQVLSTNHEYTDMHNEVGRAAFEARAVLNTSVSLQDLLVDMLLNKGYASLALLMTEASFPSQLVPSCARRCYRLTAPRPP